MVAVMIIGIMATQFPRLLRVSSTGPEQLLADLNALATQGYTRALITGKIHQLYFDFTALKPYITLRVANGTYNLQGDPECVPVDRAYGDAVKSWNDQFEIERFVINGTDEAAGAVSLKTIWIYIMPEGLAQTAEIVVRDRLTGARYGYTLNPFLVQFTAVPL